MSGTRGGVLIRIFVQFITKYRRMWICQLHTLKIVSYQMRHKNLSVSRIKHKFKELNTCFVLDLTDKAANNVDFQLENFLKYKYFRDI